ncbi:hypothetical protein [Hymenobacter koreensis]|uniref:Uncharacterized protein n=1 Tax=Hymenobacter koreensis TaxID=1084523 RepID=A0ABP8J8H4_9BACT
MYAMLLLDEGSSITATIGLFKLLFIVILYATSLYFLLHNWRKSELKPIGLIIAFILAFIGYRSWPVPDMNRTDNTDQYLTVFFLCVPLVVAGFVYFLSRNSSDK